MQCSVHQFKPAVAFGPIPTSMAVAEATKTLKQCCNARGTVLAATEEELLEGVTAVAEAMNV